LDQRRPHLIDMSTPCWLRKCFSSSFLSVQFVRIIVGETQGFTPLRPPRARYYIQPRVGLQFSGLPAGGLPQWRCTRWTE
jgi:hypothetical protein